MVIYKQNHSFLFQICQLFYIKLICSLVQYIGKYLIVLNFVHIICCYLSKIVFFTHIHVLMFDMTLTCVCVGGWVGGCVCVCEIDIFLICPIWCIAKSLFVIDYWYLCSYRGFIYFDSVCVCERASVSTLNIIHV